MVAEAYYGRPFKFYFDVLSKKDITCDVHGFSLNSRILGNQDIQKALKKYKQARETNIWTESLVSEQAQALSDYVIQEI
jgi:hypothetical protein